MCSSAVLLSDMSSTLVFSPVLYVMSVRLYNLHLINVNITKLFCYPLCQSTLVLVRPAWKGRKPDVVQTPLLIRLFCVLTIYLWNLICHSVSSHLKQMLLAIRLLCLDETLGRMRQEVSSTCSMAPRVTNEAAREKRTITSFNIMRKYK